MSGLLSYSLQTANQLWSGLIGDDLFRFEVRSGDTYAPDPIDKERSELKIEGQALTFGQIYNIEYQLKVEAGEPNTADWCILGQLHAREDAADASAGPILALELQGEKLAVVVRADPNAVGTGNPVGVQIYTSPTDVVRGQWYSVKFQVVVDPFGGGLVNVWIDGKQVANYSGEVGYNDVSGPYWKMGIYRDAAPETLAVGYQDFSITQASAMEGWTGRTYYTETSPDVITGTSSTDVLYFSGQVGVNVSLMIDGPQDTGGQGVRTIREIENLIGTRKNDIIEGDAGNNLLSGNEGIDTVSYARATSGVTVNLSLTTAQDTGGAGVDTLRAFENVAGSAHDDVLTGDDNNNTLSGGGGDDLLRGGAGADIFDGGAGTDTVSFSDANVGVTASLAIAERQGTGFGAKTFISVENLTGSAFADTLTGDANDNVLRGGEGDDSLFGGDGANALFGDAGDDLLFAAGGTDRLDGGAGVDTVSFAKATTGVSINLSVTTAQSAAGGQVTLTNIENVIGSAFADTLAGGGADNVLCGAAGDDVLIAGTTDQVLDGAAGVDTVTFARLGQGVSVSLAETGAQSTGAGLKTLLSIENLIGSDYDDTLSGNSGANLIDAGGGDDLVIVGTGSDTLDGGAGNDTVSFDRSQAAVSISLAVTSAQSTGFGAMTLTSFENLTGSAFADRLIGNGADNILSGGAGDDTIVGGGGDDVINGGSGLDTVTFANATAGVTISLASNAAQAVPGGSLVLTSIENLVGSNYADVFTLDESDSVSAGSGNDLVYAGSGSQFIDGGSGIDTISFARAAQGVTASLSETGGQATGVGLVTLAGMENLVGSAFNDVLTGNSAANTIQGGAGDDLLIVGTGNDLLDGGAGSDTASFAQASKGVSIYLTIASAQSTGFGSMTLTSIENLIGSAFDDRLVGDSGSNRLSGGAGRDILDGRDGADVLTGGEGADTFRFVTGAGRDVITDFSMSDGDRVQITKGVTYSYGYDGDDTVISFSTGDVLTVQNSHLTAADGWFVY